MRKKNPVKSKGSGVRKNYHPDGTPHALIYAYEYEFGKVADKNDLIKVGYTHLDAGEDHNKAAFERINQYNSQAGLTRHVRILGTWPVPEGRGAREFEGEVHRKLEFEGGLHRIREKGNGTEWFLCETNDVKRAVKAASDGTRMSAKNNYRDREEQTRFVKETLEFFRKEAFGLKAPRYLWNAKPRFGKTYTAYRTAEELGATKILVISRFPASVNEWRDNLYGHVNFEGWDFLTRVGTGLSPEETNKEMARMFNGPGPTVVFCSLQDINSKTSAGKAHVENICSTDWDIVFFDEYHLGGQTALNEALMGGDAPILDDGDPEQDFVISELANAKRFVMLSGTPFRALTSGVFPDDAVSTWTYWDEQRKKAGWNPAEGPNDYEMLPSLGICTFDLAEEVIQEVTERLRKEFCLNEFFKCRNGEFVHKAAIKEWLKIVSGRHLRTKMDALEEGHDEDISIYANERFETAVRHSMWVLKSKASCNAMKKLLAADPYFKHFKVKVFTGDEGSQNASQDAREAKAFLAINEKQGQRSIILTCGKLTAAVTLPELASVFMLTDTTSPELYFQAAFRAQSPWVDRKGNVLKSECFVFDFTQNRTLEVLTQYATLMLDNGNTKGIKAIDPQKALEDLTRFMPVYALELSGVREVDAAAIMAQLVAGETPAGVRDKIKSRRGITNRSSVIEEIIKDSILMSALERLEIRRNTNGKKPLDIGGAARAIVKLSTEINKYSGKRNRTKRQDKKLNELQRAKKKKVDVVRDALTAICEQILTFAYLSSHPERRLAEALLLEKDIFHKVVGIPQDVVETLYKKGAFNEQYMDRLVHKFMLLEDESLELLLPRIAEQRRAAYEYESPRKPGTPLSQNTVLEALEGNCDGQIHTPLRVTQQVLDNLPDEIWTNPNSRILDPVCKSGIFLLEATRRLDEGLANYPGLEDRDVRLRHILTNQIFGIAATYKGALITRRTLYGAKEANHPTLSCGYFDTPEGNIAYPEVDHIMTEGKCEVCGIGEDNLAFADEHRESHAYPFIHVESPSTIFGKQETKFDVIIGNPPYQIEDGGYGSSATPIYQKFVETAKKLNPTYLSFVIPARWFTGGKYLDDFRATMIADRQISHVVDYPNASECFRGVEIKGGVMIFLRNINHDGDCEWITVRDGKTIGPFVRDLRISGDVIIRDYYGEQILDKVQQIHKRGWMNEQISPSRPFGLRTFSEGNSIESSGDIKLYQKGGVGYVPRNSITKNPDWINKWKVILPKAGGDGMKTLPNAVIGRPLVAEKGSACTETYLVAGAFTNEVTVKRLTAYMKTKFFRYMVSLHKTTQDNTSKVFTFVPNMELNQTWTDRKLYKHFDLSEEEIAHIETDIQKMS